jgi:arylsulfatase A
MKKTPKNFLIFSLFFIFSSLSCQKVSVSEKAEPGRPPNFIVIFCDDMGYGDLGAYGHPTIATPNLDRMAFEGQRWTNFYTGASVCTPSRAALLTGRLPIRSGMCSSKRRVLFPNSERGLPDTEITIAEAMKQKGYSTGCIGKWHLGHLSQYHPDQHGFDYYFGVPYSNDMDRVNDSPKGREAFLEPKMEYWNLPLYRNRKLLERPTNQNTLTKRYTEESVNFIEQHQEEPFFLYLAHSMVHVPLFRSSEFAGKSLRGLYGDVMEELDWSAGQIIETLKRLDLGRNTLVVFTSDNGPWLTYDEQGGSSGLLYYGKGSTWEGGMRVPGIFWGPGIVDPGVIMDPGTTMDLMPTFLEMAGGEIPSDRIMDGSSLADTITTRAPGPRDTVFYYRGDQIWAVRKGSYKAHFITRPGYGEEEAVTWNPPRLHNLDVDPSEKYNVAESHPAILDEIQKIREEHQRNLKPGEDMLQYRLENDQLNLTWEKM